MSIEKSMRLEKSMEIETKLIYWVADTAPANWRRVEINMELINEGDEVKASWIILCFTGDSATEAEDYQVDDVKQLEMCDLFRELHAISAQFEDKWSISNLIVFDSGRYEINYQYDDPLRLNNDSTATA